MVKIFDKPAFAKSSMVLGLWFFWVVFIEVIFKIGTVKGFVFDGHEVVAVIDFKIISIIKKIQEIINFSLIPVRINIDSKDGIVVITGIIKICIKVVWKITKQANSKFTMVFYLLLIEFELVNSCKVLTFSNRRLS